MPLLLVMFLYNSLKLYKGNGLEYSQNRSHKVNTVLISKGRIRWRYRRAFVSSLFV